MDRLELQRVVVVVDDLDERVAGGQGEILLRGLALLLLLVAGLGGGEGVVAVADREQQRSHAGHAVLLLHRLIGGQAHPERLATASICEVGELKAPDVAAVLHQVEVIDLLHAVGRGGQRLDDGLIGIVDQQHHMGQLDGRVAAHAGARGDTVEHGALGGADQGAGAGGEIVLRPGRPCRSGRGGSLPSDWPALDVDERVLQRLEDALLRDTCPWRR